MTRRLMSAAFAVALTACGTACGFAADEQQSEPAKKPDCITSNTAWTERGRASYFSIELQNVCDRRLKCTVDAFVTTAKGQSQGHGTLILAAAPKGQATRKAYEMRVKSTGGMANISHSCKPI